jgi:hypothetical protein
VTGLVALVIATGASSTPTGLPATKNAAGDKGDDRQPGARSGRCAHALRGRSRTNDRCDEKFNVVSRRGRLEGLGHCPSNGLVRTTQQEARLGHLKLRITPKLDREGVDISTVRPRRTVGRAVELTLPPLLEIPGEACAAIGHVDEVYGTADRENSARIAARIRTDEENPMADADELADAIAARLIQAMSENATSDTVLKLAEAWAWVRSPGQAHGGFHPG